MKTFRKKPLRKASSKAQSAMEYLMTYGWAILIIAVVLGALYSLGVFNGAAFLGTSCIASSGFYCTNPTLSTGGVLTVTIGQATGTTFNNAYLYFVPSGTNFSTSDPGTSIGTLNSGQQVTASIPLGVGSPYPAVYTLGTPISGYLYLQFTDIYGTTEVNKIATVLTKVTATGSGGATFSQPTSIPSGIVAYVPITLSNSQSSATPSPFQQMIQINEGNYANYIAYNGNIANFEFFTQSSQILPAWIESNNSGTLTVWVKLPNGIPASSSLTIYLGFASKTTNLLSSSGTSGIGEAPQLSSIYAQYDDGASVFNNYWNFAGTSLPSGWTSSVGSSGGSVTVNNGVTLASGTTGVYNGYGTINYQFAMPSSNQIIVEIFGQTAETGRQRMYLTNTGAGAVSGGYSSDLGFDYGIFGSSEITSGDLQYYWNGYYSPANSAFAINTNYIVQYILTGSTFYWNILSSSESQIASQSTTQPTTSNVLSLIDDEDSGATQSTYYWIRFRAYPPNGVMPSVSFGGLSSA